MSIAPLMCLAALACGQPPAKAEPPSVERPCQIVGDAPYGWLYQPAYSLDLQMRMPAEAYRPQPGDIIFYTDFHWFWKISFGLAKTSHPYHSGIVVRMPDGELRTLEAGWNDTPRVELTPLPYTCTIWHGAIWFRRRKCPLTEEQSAKLTEFALAVNKHRYSISRLVTQVTPYRSRGPIRTAFLGKPKGIKDTYFCSECVLEAMVYCGVLPAETTRPRATYPRDFFFDRSINPYINRHLNLSPEYEAPQLWTPNPGNDPPRR